MSIFYIANNKRSIAYGVFWGTYLCHARLRHWWFLKSKGKRADIFNGKSLINMRRNCNAWLIHFFFSYKNRKKGRILISENRSKLCWIAATQINSESAWLIRLRLDTGTAQWTNIPGIRQKLRGNASDLHPQFCLKYSI